MTKYLVKVTSRATWDNPSFAGQTQVAFIGKGENICGLCGSHAVATHTERALYEGMIREYGYDRKCDAQRNYSYRHTDREMYWDVNAEIVRFDI